ncbi:hypothetical protein HXX76_002934 [Chlamydomonas incerta]|uniref:Uncharacterized protein n=1 Tax=Chlamydomonas incerta TaxID=51695 RepID=A0A835W7Y6_CHLIN|nr:hypothetical protein HXX76_002934 [Chlamydomonas incerta]|eukprot:KAG2442855.1 hypothetical protein HXX76_002934 [Chlamydomonas incerta]
MSTSRRSSTSSTAGTRNGPRTSSTADNVKKWVAEDTREEGKAIFKAHIKETGSLDVLSRCKKLNELLSSDVLKGKGDSKEQLKEILGILHSGPKRPSFLDKPPVTATAGKRAPPAQAPAAQPAAAAPPGYLDADALMRLLDSEDVDQATRAAMPSTSSVGPSQPAGPPPEDVDDLINLLNEASPPSGSGAMPAQQQQQRERDEAERQRKIKEAQEEAERHRKAKEEAERQRKAKEESERKRKAEEDEAKAEAQRLDRLRRGAAVCIQSAWRGHCARRLAAVRRSQRAEQQAAAVLQAAWRARRAAREHRARIAAAAALQTAVRAWRARRVLQRLRVQEFRRQHAARLIQRAYRYYRYTRGYTLGPLRVPPQGGPRPGSGSGVDGATLLSKQLRLRSAVDARLAPEAPQPSQSDDSASQHRTVVTHRERVRQVSANERTRRADLGERAVMAGSSHRDEAEAMAIARTGLVSGPPPSAPGSQLPPTPRASCGSDGGGRPLSRTGSGMGGGSRLGPEGSGRPLTAASSNEVLGALRPSSSSLRRLSGSTAGRPASPGLPPSR